MSESGDDDTIISMWSADSSPNCLKTIKYYLYSVFGVILQSMCLVDICYSFSLIESCCVCIINTLDFKQCLIFILINLWSSKSSEDSLNP